MEKENSLIDDILITLKISMLVIMFVIGIIIGSETSKRNMRQEAIEKKVGEYFINERNKSEFCFKTQEEIVKEYFEIED